MGLRGRDGFNEWTGVRLKELRNAFISVSER